MRRYFNDGQIFGTCAPWLYLLVGLLIAACKTKEPALEMRPVQGPLGLSLALPKGYASTPQGDELHIYLPEREHSRSALDISVSVSPQKPAWPNVDEKELGGRSVHYVVTEEEGGSGGPLVRLKAWVESNGRYLELESVAQPESGGDGEFKAEWAILPTLRWSGRARP